MKQKFFYFLLSFFVTGFPFFAFAQCSISGPSTIAVGYSAVYSVPANLAQCSECYDWDINNTDQTTSGSVSITGSDQNNTVSITALSAGTFSLKVTYFDETGCHVCTFSGITTACDIPESEETINFVNDDGSTYLLFFTGTPIALGGGTTFSYYWTFTYADNTTSTSTDEEPYFVVDCSNPITYSTVVITSSICTATVTKRWYYICGDGYKGSGKQLNSQIKVSPNPASSTIKFEGKELEKYRLSILDQLGNYIIKNASPINKIDIAKYKKGIYIYILTDEKGFMQKGKIIKN